VCVMDSSHSHISLSAQSVGRTKTCERSDRRCTTFNILLPWSRIQLPLLTFGLRRTGKKITKTLKIPSKQANIGALGLSAKIPSDIIVSLLSGTDNNERASHSHRNSKKQLKGSRLGVRSRPRSRSRSTQIKASQYSQSCLELLSPPQHKYAQMRDYSRFKTHSRFETLFRSFVCLFSREHHYNIVPTMHSILFILNGHHFILFVRGIK
jgi:hypothetical protein